MIFGRIIKTVLNDSRPSCSEDLMEQMFNRRSLTESSLLKKELDLFRLLVSTTAQGVCLINLEDTSIAYVNPQCEKMFGYALGELLGKPITIFNSDKNNKTIAQTIKEMTEQVNIFGTNGSEVQNKNKTGSIIWCLTHTTQLDHPDFGPVWCILYEDITLKKQIRHMLGEHNLKSFSRVND